MLPSHNNTYWSSIQLLALRIETGMRAVVHRKHLGTKKTVTGALSCAHLNLIRATLLDISSLRFKMIYCVTKGLHQSGYLDQLEAPQDHHFLGWMPALVLSILVGSLTLGWILNIYPIIQLSPSFNGVHISLQPLKCYPLDLQSHLKRIMCHAAKMEKSCNCSEKKGCR